MFQGITFCIAVCYLVSPMKHELTSLIHMLSHWVHQEESQHTHSHYNSTEPLGGLWHETMHSKLQIEDHAGSHVPHKLVAPHQHPHKTESGQVMEQEHDHKVIAFLNQMFQDTYPEQEPYKKAAIEIDVDKHLAAKTGDLPTPIYGIQNNNFSLKDRNTYKRDFPPLTPPPKHFYTS